MSKPRKRFAWTIGSIASLLAILWLVVPFCNRTVVKVNQLFDMPQQLDALSTNQAKLREEFSDMKQEVSGVKGELRQINRTLGQFVFMTPPDSIPQKPFAQPKEGKN